MTGSFGGEGGDEFVDLENHLYISMRNIAKNTKYLKEKSSNKLDKVLLRRFNIFFFVFVLKCI